MSQYDASVPHRRNCKECSLPHLVWWRSDPVLELRPIHILGFVRTEVVHLVSRRPRMNACSCVQVSRRSCMHDFDEDFNSIITYSTQTVFNYIIFIQFCLILFNSILFCFILFYSVLFKPFQINSIQVLCCPYHASRHSTGVRIAAQAFTRSVRTISC